MEHIHQQSWGSVCQALMLWQPSPRNFSISFSLILKWESLVLKVKGTFSPRSDESCASFHSWQKLRECFAWRDLAFKSLVWSYQQGGQSLPRVTNKSPQHKIACRKWITMQQCISQAVLSLYTWLSCWKWSTVLPSCCQLTSKGKNPRDEVFTADWQMPRKPKWS